MNKDSYAYYNNNIENQTIYGNLYQWSVAVDNRGICPEGFHVPSDEAFNELTYYLGGIVNTYSGGDVGGKMKETGLDHWNSPNTGATNEIYCTSCWIS